MAHSNRGADNRASFAGQKRHHVIFSNDLQYLLGLLDNVDSDDSDDEFDGYVGLDNSSIIECEEETPMETTSIQEDPCTSQPSSASNETPQLNSPTAHSLPPTLLLSNPPPSSSLPPPQLISLPQNTSNSSQTQHQVHDPEISSGDTSPPQSVSLQSSPQGSQSPGIPDFTENTGLALDLSDCEAGEFFDLYFDDSVVDNMVTESNRFASQYLEKKADYLSDHKHARTNAYRGKPILLHEIKALLAILIIMGIVSLPSMDLYWSTRWPFAFATFSSIMLRNRFELLLKFLHFNNNDNQISHGQPGHDRLFKIRPFLSTIVSTFKHVYVPQNRNICG